MCAIKVFQKIVIMSEDACDKITEFLIRICSCDISDTKVDVCTMSEKTPLLSFHADKVSKGNSLLTFTYVFTTDSVLKKNSQV